MLNPSVLAKLKGKIAIIEHQPYSRQTPELITGVIADLYLNRSVVAVIVPKPSSRIPVGQTPAVAAETLPNSPVPPAPTISNVDPRAIKREVFTDLHIRFLAIEAVNSVEYFSGVRYELTRNSVLNKVQPERLFDGYETDSIVDKLTVTKLEDGSSSYQWSKRKITEASKAATHDFCVEDVMRALSELGIKQFDPASLDEQPPAVPEPVLEQTPDQGPPPEGTPA